MPAALGVRGEDKRAGEPAGADELVEGREDVGVSEVERRTPVLVVQREGGEGGLPVPTSERRKGIVVFGGGLDLFSRRANIPSFSLTWGRRCCRRC